MLLMALLLTITPTPGPTPTPTLAPSPVVERLVTVGPRHTRFTLFDNRMAVLNIFGEDGEPFFRQLTLSQEEYIVYVTKLRQDSAIAVGPKEYQLAGLDSHAVITIYQKNGPVHEITYSPSFSLGLPLRRISDVLDDIEKQLLETNPSSEELRNWQPETGDVVELYDGRTATVGDIFGSTLVLETPDEAIVVTEEQRAAFIRHLLTERDQP